MEFTAQLDVDVVALEAEDEVTCLVSFTARCPRRSLTGRGRPLSRWSTAPVWPGAGWNRRPSDFQCQSRRRVSPLGPQKEGLPLMDAAPAGSTALTRC